MHSVFRYLAPESPCGYLPAQTWRLEYDLVAQLTPGEYLERMIDGWRRFGRALFRPQCPGCSACQSLRVLADCFRPNRTQRRLQRRNEGDIRLDIGTPRVTAEKLRLYDRYHARQSEAKGWPVHAPRDPASYIEAFVDNPFPTEEWRYYLGRHLVAIGYVDNLPGALSAIYCFYDPEFRSYSLGTWNVLSILGEARSRGLGHVYLGYYVAGCSSMEYKIRFRPHELRLADGGWQPGGLALGLQVRGR
jgi:arginine-tRNA-protein transferase